MKVSAISQIAAEDCRPRRNWFIRYSNSFMSEPTGENPIVKAGLSNPDNTEGKSKKLGIENLQEFTIFPKETVNGKTVITA
jgi:hypothetical protein